MGDVGGMWMWVKCGWHVGGTWVVCGWHVYGVSDVWMACEWRVDDM